MTETITGIDIRQRIEGDPKGYDPVAYEGCKNCAFFLREDCIRLPCLSIDRPEKEYIMYRKQVDHAPVAQDAVSRVATRKRVDHKKEWYIEQLAIRTCELHAAKCRIRELEARVNAPWYKRLLGGAK